MTHLRQGSGGQAAEPDFAAADKLAAEWISVPIVPGAAAHNASISLARAYQAARREIGNWREEAQRFAQNADYWRNRCEAAESALPATQEQAKRDAAVMDDLLAWVAEAHKDDGWNSLTTPDAVVAALHVALAARKEPDHGS